MWTFLQFCVSVAGGSVVWFLDDWPPDTAFARIVGTLLTGLATNYAFMFCVTWARFGWRTARSMRFLG